MYKDVLPLNHSEIYDCVEPLFFLAFMSLHFIIQHSNQ
jgi:hypothetical protein